MLLDTPDSLRSLAFSVGPPVEFDVTVGADTAFWNPVDHCLTLPARIFDDYTPPARAGLVLHECGHGHVSRYDLLVTPPDAAGADPLAARALNAFEEGRAETFMVQRYSGAWSWLAALYRQTIRSQPAAANEGLLSRFLRWCARARFDDWRLPSRRQEPSPRVRSLLAETLEARRAYAFCLPSYRGRCIPVEGARARHDDETARGSRTSGGAPATSPRGKRRSV